MLHPGSHSAEICFIGSGAAGVRPLLHSCLFLCSPLMKQPDDVHVSAVPAPLIHGHRHRDAGRVGGSCMKLSRMRQGIPALFLLLLLFILMPPAPACAAGLPPGTDLEKLISDAAAGRSKLNFMSLYRQLWQTGGMEKKLDLAVDAAFDEQTEELSLSGVSLVLNSDNFVEHIEEAVMAKFSADYDTFLRSLENRWNAVLLADIAAFCGQHSDLAAESAPEFAGRVWLRQGPAADEGHNLPEQTSAGAEDRITGMILSSAADEILNEAAWSVPVLNLFVMARMAWKAASKLSVVMQAEKAVRGRLHRASRKYYSEILPERIWNAAEPAVKDAYASACSGKGRLAELEQKVEAEPQSDSLCENLPEEQKREFIRRAAVVLYKLNSTDAGSVLGSFGTAIRDADPFNFARLAEMLHEHSPELIRAWLNLAGEQFYALYAEFPRSAWEKFPPTPENLEIFRWMSRRLTRLGRSSACALSADDLRWVMDSLPARYVPWLLNGRHRAAAVHREILRLAELPADDRVPWQGALLRLWFRYSLYAVLLAAAAAAALFASRFFLQRLRARRRRTVHSAEKLQGPAPAPHSGRVTVKIQIRLDAAAELGLSRMMWGRPQHAEVSGDGLYVIFTASVKSADDIVRWCVLNHEKTEIIEPEAFRHAAPSAPCGRPRADLRISTNALPPAGTMELGLVYGACCQENYAGNITAALRNATAGGELSAYTGLMTDGMKTAYGRMAEMARRMGADGIYGVQTATPQISNNAAEFLVFGTAYRFIL